MTYIAHFTPEAWVRDQAVETDAEGPQTWDCTAFAQQRLDYLEKMRRTEEQIAVNGDIDRDGILDVHDVFKDDPAAPAWVRDWRGPFTIRVRQAAS